MRAAELLQHGIGRQPAFAEVAVELGFGRGRRILAQHRQHVRPILFMPQRAVGTAGQRLRAHERCPCRRLHAVGGRGHGLVGDGLGASSFAGCFHPLSLHFALRTDAIGHGLNIVRGQKLVELGSIAGLLRFVHQGRHLLDELRGKNGVEFVLAFRVEQFDQPGFVLVGHPLVNILQNIAGLLFIGMPVHVGFRHRPAPRQVLQARHGDVVAGGELRQPGDVAGGIGRRKQPLAGFPVAGAKAQRLFFAGHAFDLFDQPVLDLPCQVRVVIDAAGKAHVIRVFRVHHVPDGGNVAAGRLVAGLTLGLGGGVLGDLLRIERLVGGLQRMGQRLRVAFQLRIIKDRLNHIRPDRRRQVDLRERRGLEIAAAGLQVERHRLRVGDDERTRCATTRRCERCARIPDSTMLYRKIGRRRDVAPFHLPHFQKVGAGHVVHGTERLFPLVRDISPDGIPRPFLPFLPALGGR